MRSTKRYLPGIVATIVLIGLVATLLATTAVHAAVYTVTVTGTTVGVTEKNIGAVEACSRFNIADLVDLGIKNYRFYAGMERLEPVDDDGVYGSPTIAQIKANPNIIPWTVWDQLFTRTDSYFWTGADCLSRGTVSLKDMLTQLKANNITPVVTLRNVQDSDPAWAWDNLNPPNTPEDWNEWWEFVFAWVYSANVRYNLNVNDWEVYNEPDKGGQLAGWGGTQADYIVFTQQTYDAIKYVYDTYLPGKTFRIYAPASAGCNTWISESLIQNDPIIDVVDWHRYGDPSAEAQTIHGWINQYDSDGVHEALYLGEWGSYRGAYNTVSDALGYATQMLNHSLPGSYIDSSAIFSFYDWSSSCTGLMGFDGTPHEPYYALRTMIRGLQGGKQEYAINHNIPGTASIYPIAAKDLASGALYVEIINNTRQNSTITLNLSAHATSGTVTIREYSAAVKDAVTGTAALSNGVVTINLPSASIIQVILPTGGGGPTPTLQPTPTPTPGAGGVMHVSNIAMSFQKQGTNYKAKATVTIVDAGGAPVSSATVAGAFTGATSDTVSGNTATGGTVTLTSSAKSGGGTWQFCVTGVTKSGWTYNSAANVETCDSITAP